MTGERVVFLNEEMHIREPRYYPAPGTIGFILVDDGPDCFTQRYYVQWPDGSTEPPGKWWAFEADVKILNSLDVPNALYRRLDKCLVNLMKGEAVSIREAEQLHGWLNRLRREQSK